MTHYFKIMFIVFRFIIFGDDIFKRCFSWFEKSIRLIKELNKYVGSVVEIKLSNNSSTIANYLGQNITVKIIDVDSDWIEVEFTYKNKIQRRIFNVSNIESISNIVVI